MEYAGRLSDGTRVMGILPAQALATSVIISKDYYWEVPRDWSLAEAATVPVVYTTAYYALVMRGRIRKGDKVTRTQRETYSDQLRGDVSFVEISPNFSICI